jgi:hypothetical protein
VHWVFPVVIGFSREKPSSAHDEPGFSRDNPIDPVTLAQFRALTYLFDELTLSAEFLGSLSAQ